MLSEVNEMLRMLGMLSIVGLLVGAMGVRAGSEALFEDIIVIPLDSARTHRGQTGSIVELNDGALLFASDSVGSGFNGVAGRESTDGGRTWGPAFQIQRNVGKLWTSAPSLLRLQNGEIMLGYNVGNCYTGDDYRQYSGHFYVRRSSDEGQTWSHPIMATLYPGYHTVNPDRLVQLSSGRILVPAEWTIKVGGGEAGHMGTLCYYTDDGHIWVRGNKPIDVGVTTEEPSVVELKDGRLMMVFRTTKGYVGKAYSEDQGDNWIDVGFMDLPSPMAPQLITRIPSTGDLLLIWLNNPHSPGWAQGEEQEVVQIAQIQRPLGQVRAPLTAAISRDEGETWEHIRDIIVSPEGDYGDYGYQGCTFIEDGTIALVNFNSRDGIHIARIGVDWFYGK